MIYLDESGQIVRVPGRTDRSLHRRMRDRSHLLTALDDMMQGKVRLRNFRDRKEIKDIELQQFRPGVPKTVSDLPYQWRTVAEILQKWSETVRQNGGGFLVFSHLAYYCVREGGLFADTRKHPWGFMFDEIPERRYLPFLGKQFGFSYFDTFAHAREQRIETDRFYVHPRYTYLNSEGAAWHAGVLADAIGAGGYLDISPEVSAAASVDAPILCAGDRQK